MIAEVELWGRTVAAVAQEDGDRTAVFQYDPEFAASGIQLSPLTMPLREAPYEFPTLPYETFRGLPGLLADSLPDRFGNALIDAWLAREGRPTGSMSSVERLCYTSTRGMGALEYHPAAGPRFPTARTIEIDHLVDLANQVLAERAHMTSNLPDGPDEDELRDILRVSTSAGGARAKAVIAWNRETGEIRSGQVKTDPGFEYWLLKFDGVSGNRDKELDDPHGFGAIEYAYSRMAGAAGIEMSECRLLEENGRRHFMTRRFDRLEGGAKLHMQTLGGLAHFDFNQAGACSYEQALAVLRRLGLGQTPKEQLFRRAVLNIVARNQDDHVKNIAFLMERSGSWRLAPAYDVIYSYNPRGAWTSVHQMSLNGKVDGFTANDLVECGKSAGIRPKTVKQILADVVEAVQRWPEFANSAAVDEETTAAIHRAHRLRW